MTQSFFIPEDSDRHHYHRHQHKKKSRHGEDEDEETVQEKVPLPPLKGERERGGKDFEAGATGGGGEGEAGADRPGLPRPQRLPQHPRLPRLPGGGGVPGASLAAPVSHRGEDEEEEGMQAILLMKTEERKAMLTEMNRLANERSGRRGGQGQGDVSSVQPRGTLTLGQLSLALKREFINANVNCEPGGSLYYFIMLIKVRLLARPPLDGPHSTAIHCSTGRPFTRRRWCTRTRL